MSARNLRRTLVLALVAIGSGAWAQESLERVVVRNRLYNVAGKLEISPSFHFMLVNQLTDHIGLNGSVAVNLFESFAIEGRAGYNFTRQTGLAREVSERYLGRDPNHGLEIADDLAGLWELKANALGGVRWAPIYGKISFLSELPVHFQAFLSAGGGAGVLHRQSLVYCRQVTSRDSGGGTCGDWLSEDRVTGLVTGAFGMRFFTHQGGAVRLELRDYVFPDRYRVNINRVVAESGGETGELAKDAGLTHLVMFDVGYTFIF